jgi:DNA invertase Pin-like site-specific DNA recombinase
MNKLLDIGEASNLLKLSHHTLYRWAVEGRVPAVQLGLRIAVWYLSRTARSTLHALRLLHEFEHLTVHLIAVKQTFDTDTPLGKAFLTLAAGFAELERSILIGRVLVGMVRARVESKRMSRPVCRVDLEHLRRLRAEGFSVRQIAHRTETIAKLVRLFGSPAAADAHQGAARGA